MILKSSMDNLFMLLLLYITHFRPTQTVWSILFGSDYTFLINSLNWKRSHHNKLKHPMIIYWNAAIERKRGNKKGGWEVGVTQKAERSAERSPL